MTGAKIADGAVVRSLNGLTDEVTLVAGDNVTITPTGQTLTIGAIDWRARREIPGLKVLRVSRLPSSPMRLRLGVYRSFCNLRKVS